MPFLFTSSARTLEKGRCNGCKNYCAKCYFGSVYREPYPLPISSYDRLTPNTYARWAEDNETAIICWVREHCDPRDWEAQEDWMFTNKYAAFQILNYESMKNEIKIGQMISHFRAMFYGVLVIVGRQESGKTMTFAWIAESIHILKPNRGVYYVGKGLQVPEWMHLIEDIRDAPNGSILGIDEAAIRASARRSQSKTNEWMSSLCAIVRHKKLILVFLTQTLELLERNVGRRLATGLIFKPMSKLAIEGEGSRGLMDRLDPFLPRDNNETLWVDLKKDQVLPFFQPMPVEDMGNLGDAFVNYDVTQKERLFGKQQEVVKYIKPVQGAITCEKCGSSWETKSTNWKVRCNSCGHRTPNPYYRGPMIQPIQNNTANPLAATSPIAPARGVAAPAQVCKE